MMRLDYRIARIQRLYSALRAVEDQIILGEQWSECSEFGSPDAAYAARHAADYRERRISIIRRLQLRGENVEL